MSELTENNKTDEAVANQMMPYLPKSVKNSYGDGTYDRQSFYKECHNRGITSIVPPRRGGRLSNLEKKPWMKNRNDVLRAIKGLGGRKLWKKLCGYHKRSLAETAMYRFKRIFGGDFRSRKLEYQRAKLFAKSLVMNKITKLRMPKRYWNLAA